MHIALICPAMQGHLNPMTTLGQELARRGHRVTLVAGPDARPAARRTGLPFLPLGQREYDSGETAAALAKLATMKGFAAVRFSAGILRDQCEITLRDAPGLLAGAEAVVVDEVSPAGAAVADKLGLPFVVACNALALHREPTVPPPMLSWRYRPGWVGRVRNWFGELALTLAARPVVRAVNRYRRLHRLRPFSFGRDDGYGLAQVAQQPAFFDYPRRRLPNHFHYTGPWHADGRDADVPFPWERLDGRPLIYASLGTMQNRLPHVFAAILDGCAGLDAQLVLSLGRADAAWGGPVPANAVVVPFAPQLRLLARAAALITHAGLNTALEGLARGLPMLCLPVTNDQPGVARRVEWLGAGEVLAPSAATPARVGAALRRLLSAGKYRAAARRCGDELAAGPGVGRAADVVEQAFRTRSRVER